MDFRPRGFDLESHYSQVFPRASLSSSSNFVNSSAHVTNDGGGTFGGCHVMDIHREIEKERIREEIIAAEIERRRVLEAEVRRELMIESEMMALQSGGGFPSSLRLETPLRTHYHDHRFKPEILHVDWFIPDDRRVATPFPENYVRGGSHTCEIGGFEAVPFRQRPPSTKITSNRPKDGKAIIGLGKPSGATFSGSKREAELSQSSSAVHRSNGDSSSTSNIKKKKEEWKCMVCDISATSERHLNEHLSGKKHHAQMEALKPYNNNNNNGVSEIKEQPSDLKELDKKIAGECTRKKLRFWCSMCQVDAPDEKSMSKHKKGKKHLKNLLKKARGNTKLT